MVTILLATYNGETYLRQQLDSLLNQTHKELFILISDDLSSDRTPGIIKGYEKKYPNQIKSLKNIKASGSPQNNFFRLLSSADDDYIMLCDQDDIWLPHKVEVTLKEMKQMELKWGNDLPLLVHGDLSVTDEEGTIRQKSMARFQNIAVHDNRFTHYLVENNITGNTVMINRSFLSYLTYIPKQCMMHDWWLGLLASCFGKISYIDQPLLLYRQHGSNQVGSRGQMEQYVSRLTQKERVKEEYRKMFLQARAFLKQYGQEMDSEKREALEQFVTLPDKSRLEKVSIIWKYKFYKSTIIRTFGQMLSI
ncbi:glycosyltransferase family 2 protein [Lacrimispora sp.]|uniref:glycosyltransferase family 2 protein n=1 Tax=Lacrimispora sp. TaxID=2719234 RepID=UPI0028AE8635|nr:glycosyltransferase family 2 protein [Lacrimispora sp.]